MMGRRIYAIAAMLLLLRLVPRAVPQEVPDATAAPTVAHDVDGSPAIDDPEGEYEKKDPPRAVLCDDGIGPDPNRMPPALPSAPPGESGGTGESDGGGLGSVLRRVVRHVVTKYSNIDMQTGRPFEKPKPQRIPMCPGAKPRRPVPGVDCEIVTAEEEKLNCCDCGCGCCSMLRRVAKRTTNKFRNIDMTTGKPFKALPSCEELHALQAPRKRDDLPLKRLLEEKAANIAKAKKKAGR